MNGRLCLAINESSDLLNLFSELDLLEDLQEIINEILKLRKGEKKSHI